MMTPEELEEHLKTLSHEELKVYLCDLIDRNENEDLLNYKKVMMEYKDVISEILNDAVIDVNDNPLN